MFQYFGNSLNVIGTNRIVQNEFSQTAGENIANEMALLWERGAFRNGLFRGLSPLLALTLTTAVVNK